jgi:hypothetical protein
MPQEALLLEAEHALASFAKKKGTIFGHAPEEL